MPPTTFFDARWLHMLAAAAFIAASAPHTALSAQGLESKDAVDTIIGSEVEEEEIAGNSRCRQGHRRDRKDP